MSHLGHRKQLDELCTDGSNGVCYQLSKFHVHLNSEIRSANFGIRISEFGIQYSEL